MKHEKSAGFQLLVSCTSHWGTTKKRPTPGVPDFRDFWGCYKMSRKKVPSFFLIQNQTIKFYSKTWMTDYFHHSCFLWIVNILADLNYRFTWFFKQKCSPCEHCLKRLLDSSLEIPIDFLWRMTTSYRK